MRILHLIDGGFRDGRPGPERALADAAAGAVGLLMHTVHHEQVVCVLGPRCAARRVAAAGTPVHGAIAPVLGLGRVGAIAIRRFASGHGPFDAVQAWGGDAAGAACMALGEHRVAAVAMDDGFTPGARVIAVGVAAADRARERWGHGAASPIAASPPALARERDEVRSRSVRLALGVAETEILLLLVGRPGTADALRFCFLVSLLAVAGRPVVGVLPGWAGQLGRADRFMRDGRRPRVVLTDRPAPDLLRAADLAVLDGGGPGPTSCHAPAPWIAPWPIAEAHAAGVPVVAPAWANVDGVYPANGSAPLAGNSTLPELARVLMPLVEDAERRQRLGSEVRAHVAAADPAARFARSVERAWTEIAAS